MSKSKSKKVKIVKLKRGGVASWLKAQGRNIVGEPGDCWACPLVTYLEAVNPSATARTCVTTKFYTVGDKMFTTPKWAVALMDKVDAIKNVKRVRAVRVLGILRSIK